MKKYQSTKKALTAIQIAESTSQKLAYIFANSSVKTKINTGYQGEPSSVANITGSKVPLE